METAKGCVLGMDCGTTNIKAILLSEEGTVLAETSRPSTFLSSGPGIQEQDANEWWGNAVGIFQDLKRAAGADVMARLRGICISSHTVSLLPVDDLGVPLRNALTYQDTRSAPELQEILERVGRDRFIRIVGGQPAVAFLPNKLLWYRAHEPELFARTKCFLQASSYINFKLTGAMTTDIDQASRTQCLDNDTMKWSPVIGEAVGVELDKLLPPPLPVDAVIGQVTDQAAGETGIPAGTPVLAGCSDAMAALYATGVSGLGDAGESSGTTSLVFIGSTGRSAPDAAVTTKPCAIPGMPWVYDAPIQSSGAAIKWFIEKLGSPERAVAEARGISVYDYLNELALEAAPGSGGLLFFPYLMGERAPLWNDHASGMFVGMRMTMSRAELVRSVFEGTAFALRHVVETVAGCGGKAERLYLCGGGAKSRTWSRIKASVLNMPVHVLDERSGDVPLGDALMAGCKVGLFADLPEAAKKAIRVREIIQPDPAWSAVYDKLYPHFLKTYQCLDSELREIQKTLRGLN